MIPGIEEIIAGLLSGQYTAEQARAWIAEHSKLDALTLTQAAHVALAVLEVVPIHDDEELEADAKTACDALRVALGVGAQQNVSPTPVTRNGEA